MYPTTMALFMCFYAVSSLVFAVKTQVTSSPSYDNSTLLTTMGFDGGGLFLKDFQCPLKYLCPNPLSTKSKVLPKWDDLNCQCDDACAVYGDCCINAKLYSATETILLRKSWKCLSFVEYQGLYMRTSCPSSWPADEIRKRCENDGVLDANQRPAKDPLSMTPVTSLSTRHTYQNFYCAYCSGDVKNVIYWIPRLECDDINYYNLTFGNITDDFVWSNLEFNDEVAEWGIFINNYTSAKINSYMQYSKLSSTLITNGNISNFITCRVMVQMPPTVVDLVRQCKPAIDGCPADKWKNETVRRLCHSYTGVVFGSPTSGGIFKNVHCAICNGIPLQTLGCYGELLYRNINPSIFIPSFAFLFDINESTGQMVGTIQRCTSPGEIFDPFFKLCRQMVCANSNYTLRNGRCVLLDIVEPVRTESINSTLSNKTSLAPSNTEDTIIIKHQDHPLEKDDDDDEDENEIETNLLGRIASNMTNITAITNKIMPTNDKNVTDCPRFNISWLHYHVFSNGGIFIKEYNKYYGAHEYILGDDGSILICMPLDADNSNNFYKKKFSIVLAYLTVTCLGISLLCLVMHLLVFTQVPSLRNLQGKDLISLCISLIVAYVSFIISQFEHSISDEICAVVSVILYYGFIASFFWMNAISFDVWRTLCRATSELRVSNGQQWKKFIIYSAYSWLGSAAAVCSAIIVENSPNISQIYKPSFGVTHCWFNNRRALLIFFVIPVIIIVMINVLMFSMSAHIIVTTTRNSAILHPNSKAKRNFQIYLRLALIMGLTWIFGIVAGLVDWEPLWYVFVILNALQGLFIFMSFTCTRKVRMHLVNKSWCRRNRGWYFSSAGRDVSRRKINLEVRDSGSGESQSSQTSHSALSKTSSNISRLSTDSLY